MIGAETIYLSHSTKTYKIVKTNAQRSHNLDYDLINVCLLGTELNTTK